MIVKISASAGSGKTYELTERFLNLLERADQRVRPTGCALSRESATWSLAEILAATFTNKAAAEMKSRVVTRLKKKALAARAERPGRGDASEQWVERILRHYGSLNIRTIDSLLVTLVRLSSLQLGLAPDFEPSFAAAEYFSPLYDSLMADLGGDVRRTASGGTAAEPRFLTSDAARLRECLRLACRSLLHTADFRGFTPGDRFRNMTGELVDRLLTDKPVPRMDSSAMHAELKALHSRMLAAAETLHEALEAEKLQADKRFLSWFHKCRRHASPYQPLQESAYADKQELDQCLLKASKGRASGHSLASFVAFILAVGECYSSQPLLLHALKLAPLAEVALEIHARMQDAAPESRLLPACRLPLLAGQALSGEFGVSDALCRLGTRLSCLLLDELQDTSRELWEAIRPRVRESLYTGGGLTLVGDVKQAIYGWRGGDARLFNAVVEDPELLAVSPDPVLDSLKFNWRSDPAIVKHNNAFFGLLSDRAIALQCLKEMLGKDTPQKYVDWAADAAVSYFSGAAQEIPPEKDWEADPKHALAEAHLYEIEKGSAAQVAERVRERLYVLFRDSLLPHWGYGDIALLVRSNEDAALLAAWLTAWGLPVVTENSFLLAEHPLVGRLISFLGFLDYPLDDLAFWEFAGGPECLGAVCDPGDLPGADWPAVKKLEQGEKHPPVYQLFRQEYRPVWERWIAPFYNEAGLMSAYDTLREIIRRYGLVERLPEQAPFVYRLLELAHLAETRGHSSLAAFLAFWRDCRGDEKLPLPESMDAVRIMTMHKAKGLEFPVVVLPFSHKGHKGKAGLAAVPRNGVTLLTKVDKNLGDTYNSIYYEACAREELERLNLLYVSWTRPKYALHAFITRTKQTTSLSRGLDVLLDHYRDKAPPGSCVWETPESEAPETAEPSLEQGLPPLVPPPEYPGENALESDVAETAGAAAGRCSVEGSSDAEAAPWRPMNWLPRLKIYRSTLEGAQLSPRRRGILAHLCLEQLMLSPDGQNLREDVARAVRQGMRLFPLPVREPERAAREMEECLYWFAGLPEAPLWLAHGKREQGIADSRGDMRRVDLLIDLPDGTLIALDYTTGAFPDSETLHEHRRQVQGYMRLLQEALNRPAQGLLVYLDARVVEELEPLWSPA
jgi:ATP-dependent exoDNAse (exonuclease V) beta subunit